MVGAGQNVEASMRRPEQMKVPFSGTLLMMVFPRRYQGQPGSAPAGHRIERASTRRFFKEDQNSVDAGGSGNSAESRER